MAEQPAASDCTYCVGAVDPGKVNPAAWVGIVDLGSNTVRTLWAAASTDITDKAAGEGDGEGKRKKKKKPTITDVGVEVGRMVLGWSGNMGGRELQGIVVETGDPATLATMVRNDIARYKALAPEIKLDPN